MRQTVQYPSEYEDAIESALILVKRLHASGVLPTRLSDEAREINFRTLLGEGSTTFSSYGYSVAMGKLVGDSYSTINTLLQYALKNPRARDIARDNFAELTDGVNRLEKLILEIDAC